MRLLRLRVRTGQDAYFASEACVSMVLEREVYTPYERLTAVFLGDGSEDCTAAVEVELFWNETSIFLGIADKVEKYQRGGVWFLRVESKTFTSLLTQNELEEGLHSHLTIRQLVTGFYTLPHVTSEEDPTTGYIYVRERMSMWDSVASFVFKITGRYPYVDNNMVRFSLGADVPVHEPAVSLITEIGRQLDTTKLVSDYHMSDIDGNPNAYQESNPAAQQAQIVRNKQLAFDRQFLSSPQMALVYRRMVSCRGMRANFLTYAGFNNEKLGEKLTCGQHLQNKRICRVRVVFGTQGLRTSLWAYEDGFFNNN